MHISKAHLGLLSDFGAPQYQICHISCQCAYVRTQVDLDLGASGAIPIKGKYVITGGKQGPLYIADAMNLGGYQPLANNTNVYQVCTLLGMGCLCVV